MLGYHIQDLSSYSLVCAPEGSAPQPEPALSVACVAHLPETLAFQFGIVLDFSSGKIRGDQKLETSREARTARASKNFTKILSL